MSSLTQCNFCGLENIKRRANDEKLVVTILPSHRELKGLDVYVHPKDISIHLLRKPTREKYWRCWYWAIGAKCECLTTRLEKAKAELTTNKSKN